MSPPDKSLGLEARARLGSTLRGKYRLEAVLGVGGMAVVYRAKHRNRAEFALKILLPELARDEEIRTRFLREGYVANSVKHPGVVQVVDDDVSEDGAAFLVMELLEGLSADELWERRGHRLPPDIALAVGHQLLDVLASAHAAGIVHRDIKPANVFVTKEGQVKVLDFGIARVRDATFMGASMTQSGVSFGTPAFMPPEQAMGKTREVDERSDIYAVGAALFTIMTGKLVHEGENSPMIMVKTATEHAAPITTLLPNLAPDLALVVDGALRFQKEQRWQTAAQMRDALESAYVAAFGEAPNIRRLAAYVNSTPRPATPSQVDDPTKRANLEEDTTLVGGGGNVGGVTAKPVSSDSDRRAGVRASSWIWGAVTVAMLAAIGIVGTRALLGHSTATDTSASVLNPRPSAPPPSTTVLPSIKPEPTSSIPAVAVSSLPTPSTAHVGTAQHVGVSHTTPSASASAKPNCTPNFTLDAKGQKHFKPECFVP